MHLCHEGHDILATAGSFTLDDVKVYAVSAGFVGDETSTYATLTAATGAIEGSPQTLAGKTVTNGIYTALDPVFDDIADGDDNITQAVYTVTVAATEYLWVIDDNPNVAVDPDGTDVTLQIDPLNGIVKVTTA